MADEIVQPVDSMNGGPAPDNLNDSLMKEFENAGVKIDVTPHVEPTQEKTEQVVDEKEPDEKVQRDPDQDVKPEEVRAKGPLPKTAKAKSDPIAPKSNEEPLSDPEKIKPPPNLSKAGLEGWNALKESSKKAHAIVEKQRAEIAKVNLILADKSKATNAELESAKKELEELRGYRASFDYQFDPEFKKNYSEPIGKLESDMKKMLLDAGVREDVIKTLDWTDATQMDRVSKSLDEHVNSITSDRFRMRAKDLIELNSKKQEFLEEFKGKHKEFTSKRAEEIERKSVESGAMQMKHVNEISVSKNEKGEYQFPFLLKFDVQEGSTPEEVKRVEDHNKMADVMRGRLQNVMAAKDPQQLAQVSIAAVAASFLNQKLKESTSEIQSLKEELKKYNDLSSERRGPQSKPSGGGGYKTPESLELSDALASAFPGMR